MVRLLICVNILRLSHFRTCLWHFSLRRTWPTWAFHYSAHVYMFSDVLAPRPHSMSFYIKKPDVKLYPFFDELSWWSSSPRPQSMSKLQKFLDSKGRTRLANLCRARSRLYRRWFLQVNTRWKALAEIYKMYTLLHRSDLNISANLWVRSDDIDWGQGERM